MGHTVLQATSGHEALAMMREGCRVDLVVTDQAMPGMTGTQLASTLRAGQPDLGILVVSGNVDLPTSVDDNLPRLSKPFDQTALAQAISAILAPRTGADIRSVRAKRFH
jgi:CheY-like chemotaxis protein